jgi:serine/threonine protein kinase
MNDQLIKLGRYTLLEQIGSGSIGTVYRASDPAGSPVAVKVLKPGLVDDPAAMQRFQREASVRLYHKHIATITDFDEQEGRFFLVMRYISGPSLDKLIRERGRLDWALSLQILDQLADALDYAHENHIIHRDIKPANIMVGEREGAVLTDFSLVRLAESSSLSTSGAIHGTPAYIAPEVWEGKTAGPAADLYSLACVACEMLTGQVLFGGESTPAVMTRHLQPAAPLPESWPADLPEGIGLVLARALERDPERRFASAGQFVAELRKKGDARQRLLQQETRRAQQSRLDELLQQAGQCLTGGSLDQARDILNQAAALVPDDPAVQALREKLDQQLQAERLYSEIAGLVEAAREKARQLFSLNPRHPDPRGLLPLLRVPVASTVSDPHRNRVLSDLSSDEIDRLFFYFFLLLQPLLSAGLGVFAIVTYWDTISTNLNRVFWNSLFEQIPFIAAGFMILGGVYVVVVIFLVEYKFFKMWEFLSIIVNFLILSLSFTFIILTFTARQYWDNQIIGMFFGSLMLALFGCGYAVYILLDRQKK